MSTPEVHARVALVADTHGKVDEKLKKLFRNVSLLVHAGDVNDEATLAALHKLLPGIPTLVVRGNNDAGVFGQRLPEVAHVDVQGVRILAAHTEAAATAALADPANAKARLVVVGHSHKPSATVRDGRLWVNPGGAGPKRFALPRGAALLEIRAAGALVVRIHGLEEDALPVLAEARLGLE